MRRTAVALAAVLCATAAQAQTTNQEAMDWLLNLPRTTVKTEPIAPPRADKPIRRSQLAGLAAQ